MNLARSLRTAAKAVRLFGQALDEAAEEIQRDGSPATPANDAPPKVSEVDRARARADICRLGLVPR